VLQIERRLWNRGWLSKRARKLPGAMACLETLVESVGQFQRRRVDWVIGEMDRAGEPLQAWRVLRRAGLDRRHVDMVAAALDRRFGDGLGEAA
jgi:hypothetical protein